MFAAAGDQDLVRGIREAVLAPEFGDDRLLELRGAVHRRVSGEAVLDGGDGRLLDVIGRIEVRFPGAESDDVLTGGAQGVGTGRNGEGGGGLDGLYAGGKLGAHSQWSLPLIVSGWRMGVRRSKSLMIAKVRTRSMGKMRPTGRACIFRIAFASTLTPTVF